MQLKPLEWAFVDEGEGYWKTTSKMLPAVRFCITRDPGEGHFIVEADTRDIEKTRCVCLQSAFEKAQELYDSYAIYLSII